MLNMSDTLPGLILLFLGNPEIGVWQKSWTVEWLTAHISAVPGIRLLPASEHLKLMIAGSRFVVHGGRLTMGGGP